METATIDLRSVYQPVPFSAAIDVSLDDIERELAHNSTDMSPPYQRGSVWSQAQQERFMGHLLQGGEVLPIIFHRVPESGHAEVLDGKQRLEACLAWLRSAVPALLDDGRLVYVDDLQTRQAHSGQGTAVAGLSRVNLRFRYVNLPWDQRVRFYVRLNSAGTPHTQEQLVQALAARPRTA